MANGRAVYRVQADPEGWWTLSRNEGKVDQFDEKSAAVRTGMELAGADRPSKLVVHGRDGKIEEESTYHESPIE